MNAIKAILFTAFLALAHGCANQGEGEPNTIIGGAEGEVEWGFSCSLDLSNLGCDVHGKRDKEPSNVD